jgi:hypothetical protein
MNQDQCREGEAAPAEPAVIANMRQVVCDHSAMLLDPVTGRRASKRRGVLVDLFSASAVITVYDGLTRPEYRAHLARLPVVRMVQLAFKVLERAERGSSSKREAQL